MVQYGIIVIALAVSIFYIIKKLRKELSSEAQGCNNCELKK